MNTKIFALAMLILLQSQAFADPVADGLFSAREGSSFVGFNPLRNTDCAVKIERGLLSVSFESAHEFLPRDTFFASDFQKSWFRTRIVARKGAGLDCYVGETCSEGALAVDYTLGNQIESITDYMDGQVANQCIL